MGVDGPRVPATEKWEAIADGRDSAPDVAVNWPQEVVAYLDGGKINDDPIAVLRIGGVRFRRPISELVVMCDAAKEQLLWVQMTQEPPS